MTPRERVTAAIARQEPDRVPTALWGGPYGLVDDVYLKMLDLLDLGEPVAPFRQGHNISYIDDRVLDILETDTRYVWPGDSPSSPKYPSSEPGMMLDGYGQPWIQALPYYYPDTGLLVEAAGVDDIDRLVTWPDPDDPCWTKDVGERAKQLKENTDYYVIGRMVTSHGVFQTCSDLRGMEQFMMDLVIDEDFAVTLIERVTENIAGLLRGYLEAGGAHLDMVELPGDDYASSQNLMMSPGTFRQFFKPVLRRLVETVKSFRDDLKVMFHSDGVVHPLIPDLVDIGIDVLHPVEPLPKMDLVKIKTDYGDSISFLGGIDITHALPGSRQDVIDEVRRRIGQLAHGGGYILAPSNHVQPDVPAENVLTLYQAARQYGSMQTE